MYSWTGCWNGRNKMRAVAGDIFHLLLIAHYIPGMVPKIDCMVPTFKLFTVQQRKQVVWALC